MHCRTDTVRPTPSTLCHRSLQFTSPTNILQRVYPRANANQISYSSTRYEYSCTRTPRRLYQMIFLFFYFLDFSWERYSNSSAAIVLAPLRLMLSVLCTTNYEVLQAQQTSAVLSGPTATHLPVQMQYWCIDSIVWIVYHIRSNTRYSSTADSSAWYA